MDNTPTADLVVVGRWYTFCLALCSRLVKLPGPARYMNVQSNIVSLRLRGIKLLLTGYSF